RRTLAGHSTLAEAVVIHALRHATAVFLAEIALEVRPVKDYLIPAVLASLTHADYAALQSLLDRLGRAWLDGAPPGVLDAKSSGEWLTAEPWRTWIEKRLSPWHGGDFAIVRLAERIDLAVVLALVRQAVSGLGAANDWAYALLLPALRLASTETITSTASEL